MSKQVMELKRKADAVTAEDWRQIAEHYEYNWRTCSEGFNSICGELRQQLAESQAREKVLRDALETLNTHFPGNEHHLECERVYALVTNALALPSDSTALEAECKRHYELGSQQQQQIQDDLEGWQLVPIEPTEEMFVAGDQFMECTSSLGEAWEAMLSAAPKYKEEVITK